MNTLLEKSDRLVNIIDTSFKRYLHNEINWNNRLIGIKGARGTGKTTLILQRLYEIGRSSSEAVYLALDDLYFSSHSFMDTADIFYKKGGKYLFLDEVHKFPGWSQAIKNLYDFYPDLHIVFTGSSIIDIAKEEADLSRRVLMHELFGLSYREFLEFKNGIKLPVISLQEILGATDIRKMLTPEIKPLKHFEEYLSFGYYPFFKDDPPWYHQRLQQLIRIIVEYDMAELRDFDIRNAKKMLQLLSILAENVPFKPNLSKLAEKSNIHRNSMNSYLNYLEQARLINMLYPSGISTTILQKPEKVYLNNSNLASAISINQPDKGNLRETFFLSQLKVSHTIQYPAKGDFMVDGSHTFEIGGKNKTRQQIKEFDSGFIVKDDLEFPAGDAMPLWLFGFLY
ncbi:MAG: AAA family ATPase [Cyclobacteriaceae bacterium]